MKKLLLIAFGCFIALPAFTQTKFYEQWWFLKPTESTVTDKGYTRIVIEPAANDTATYVYTISRVKKVWQVQYDSVWTFTDIDNTSTDIKYFGSWVTGTGLTKFLNGTFAYGNPVGARSVNLLVNFDKPGRLEFFSERFSEGANVHGLYTIKIDSDAPVTINAGIAPLVSDKDRGKGSFKSKLLSPGPHTLTINTSAQMVVDFVRVHKVTLNARP